MELEGPCRTAGCREQHRHPVTGALPDYHWVSNSGEKLPRWIRQSYRKPGSDHREWFYRPSEVARACGCTPETVRIWIRDGKLHAYGKPGKGIRGSPGAHFLVKGCDLEDFLRSRGQAYPNPATKE